MSEDSKELIAQLEKEGDIAADYLEGLLDIADRRPIQSKNHWVQGMYYQGTSISIYFEDHPTNTPDLN